MQEAQKLVMSGVVIDLMSLSETQLIIQKLISTGKFVEDYVEDSSEAEEMSEIEKDNAKESKTGKDKVLVANELEQVEPDEMLASGRFIQGMYGGYVEEIRIPEKMVRDIGIEHGDYCEIIGQIDKMYISKVVPADKEDRIRNSYTTIKYCKAKSGEQGEIFFDEDYNGDSLYSWSEVKKLLLSEENREKWNVKVGSLVDLRFDNRQDKPKVELVWVYKDDELGELTKKDVTPTLNKKQGHKSKKSFSPDNAFELNGAKIAILSGSQFESKWRKAIEENGGEFLFFDTPNKMLSQKERVKSIMDKADLTLVPLDMMSHDLYDTVKHLAKQNGYSTGAFYKFSAHAIFEAIKLWKDEQKSI